MSDDFLLSIVIPCFNEKHFLKEAVEKVVQSPVKNKEIILIDDGSTDGTKEIIEKEISHKVSKVIYHEKNLGKGAALRKGFAEAKGDIVIIQDADLEYDPAEYPRIIKPILEGKADVVYGSRFVGSQEHRVLYFWHMVGNKFLTRLSNIFTNLTLTDMETCYKAFRKSTLDKIKLEENRFGVEAEITAKIAELKCRIYEVGISYSGRTYQQGKKINWRDGFWAVFVIIKYALCRQS
ncbi:MAG: glycosyltransferase family 2 protein [Candidatus Omnitrophica bacterium]|nr:glycosyltransferase family 2 protein [Candidatus Omnitrophota bacterium]MBU2043724.1 glycosyltransferase family 2 protein [Candidatus Omnitrophota bacterium]MBU2474034.1 glycosyltransferase family 2 protein [Candidatus Omnitrophota bacterium]